MSLRVGVTLPSAAESAVGDGSKLERPQTFVWLATAVVVIGGLLWAWTTHAYPDLRDRASFGSIFGGINALFAGLAFAALAYTLILQQRALALQRAQTEEQHRELLRQNERLRLQSFEAMLVQLLQFHHELTRDIHVRNGIEELAGRGALRFLADELHGIVMHHSGATPRAVSVGVAQGAYEEFRKKHRAMLDHYFRNLYHVIKFIDREGLADPSHYTSLARAQLSSAELLLLLYNGLSSHGEKFKPLIEKYALLAQLPESEIPVPSHKSIYAPGAYR